MSDVRDPTSIRSSFCLTISHVAFAQRQISSSKRDALPSHAIS